MPRHVNPTSPDRAATAPYNFVPLPERVLDVADGIQVGGEMIKPWEMHDRFVPGTNSGSIELTIETLTPLFIRGAVGQRQDGAWDDRDSRLRPEPYTTPDGRPAIPGSSLRGMVRTLVEILSFSKIQPVDDGKPFFRTVADDRIGRTYRSRMTAGGGKPRGGMLRLSELGATIEPREVVRVRRDALGDIQFDPRNPNYTPPWPQQHGRCWVKVGDRSLDVSEIRLQEQQPTGSGWRAATLVLTGNAPRKKREFVFLEPQGAPPPAVRVPDTVLTRFHDEDQITIWQERAFPRDRPADARRRAAGHLRHDEPVFFVLSEDRRSEDNPDGLVFLGRAGMFRFPYDCSPADLVPGELRDARLDVAEAMFGKVDTSRAIKGRVHFEDAIATAGGPPWCEAAMVPRILSAPKPTTFQHYLTQDGTRGREQLTTYIDGDQTTIRGHKLFWHRDDGSGVTQIREANHDGLLRDLRGANPQDTQHTIIQPVRRAVTFGGHVRFENLTDLELGALLCALQLPDGCAHRLGMGKPLGLGSIRLTAHLRLVDRGARYRTWQSSGVQEGEDGGRFRSAFGEAILEHARISQEPLQNGQQGLRQIARLDVLMRVLEWTNRPLPAATAYMNLDGFRNRPVLPAPHGVAGASEPPWPADPPQPASAGAGRDEARSARPDRTAGRQDARRSTSSRRQERSAPRPAQPPTGVKVGDTVEVVLLEEKTKKGGWKARHQASGLEGPIQNSPHVPADRNPGDRVSVLVKIAKGKESAFEATARTADVPEKGGKT